MKQISLVMGLLATVGPTVCLANDSIISSLKLDSVAIIAAPIGLHKAGNIEIAVRNGFSLSGLNCTDNYWVTTLKTTDPDGAMLALLNSIRTGAIANASIMITDDPLLTAYPGRCSIRAIQR